MKLAYIKTFILSSRRIMVPVATAITVARSVPVARTWAISASVIAVSRSWILVVITSWTRIIIYYIVSFFLFLGSFILLLDYKRS
jgi:hypothetical protein